jgi:hypothetical protein
MMVSVQETLKTNDTHYLDIILIPRRAAAVRPIPHYSLAFAIGFTLVVVAETVATSTIIKRGSCCRPNYEKLQLHSRIKILYRC